MNRLTGSRKFRSLMVVALSFLSTLAGAALRDGTIDGRVVSINDGTTLIVLDLNTRVVHKVRLNALTTPENRWSDRSKQSLHEMCAGKAVTVRVIRYDSERNKVGDVVCGGVNANEEQLRRGFVKVDAQFTRGFDHLTKLEKEAMTARRGMWS